MPGKLDMIFRKIWCVGRTSTSIGRGGVDLTFLYKDIHLFCMDVMKMMDQFGNIDAQGFWARKSSLYAYDI